MSSFDSILSLIFNIIMSVVTPIIQLLFNLLLTLYNTFDAMIEGIINAIDIFNENNMYNNPDEQ